MQLVFKTSFSRSNPVPRGQATVIRSFIRGNPKATNNKRSRVTSFLPTSGSSFVSGRLDHPRHHWNRLRTLQAFAQNTWKPPDQSSLHNFAEQAPGISPGANLYFFKDKDVFHSHQHQNLGGAERDRTADPLLAKQVLSQLSYSPIQVRTSRQCQEIRQRLNHPIHTHTKTMQLRTLTGRKPVADRSARRPQASSQRLRHCREDKTWWARVDSNYRPHAYQACALTN